MNNEPVAWMIDTLDGKHLMLYGSNPPPVFDSKVNAIPLYTHPVEEQDESFDRTASHMAGEYVSYKKELTDEEITQIAYQTHLKAMTTLDIDCLVVFARAILKKASEK